MNTTDLQLKFNRLKEELNDAKVNKARTETLLESEEKALKKLESEILELAGVDTIKEAEVVLSGLKDKLETMVKEAEALLE